MDGDGNLKLTGGELAQFFSDAATVAKFPPVLSTEQAAVLLRVPVGTLRDWRSRGLLTGCGRRAGKQVLYLRDRLLKRVFNDGLGE